MNDQKKAQPLDPDGNTTSTKNVPDQGKMVGASHANQGGWQEPKDGKITAPPERGHVEKPVEETNDRTERRP